MRPPRHRFSDNTRAITRSIATAMVENGAITRTSDELDAWIAERPQVRRSLEDEGYDKAFDAADLFPLLEAMVGRTATPAATASPPSRKPNSALLAGGALVVAIVIGLIIGLLG